MSVIYHHIVWQVDIIFLLVDLSANWKHDDFLEKDFDLSDIMHVDSSEEYADLIEIVFVKLLEQIGYGHVFMLDLVKSQQKVLSRQNGYLLSPQNYIWQVNNFLTYIGRSYANFSISNGA